MLAARTPNHEISTQLHCSGIRGLLPSDSPVLFVGLDAEGRSVSRGMKTSCRYSKVDEAEEERKEREMEDDYNQLENSSSLTSPAFFAEETNTMQSGFQALGKSLAELAMAEHGPKGTTGLQVFFARSAKREALKSGRCRPSIHSDIN